MSDEELLKMIEEIENENLHKAPDYLKNMTLKKIEAGRTKEKLTKAEQLFYYKVRVFAAMAASLLLLFAMPQPQKEQQASERTSVMQNVHQKSNELCSFLNQFSNSLVLKEDF